MNPTKKSKPMNDFIKAITGINRQEAIKEKQICMFCKLPAIWFRDSLSKKEYTISGLCQKCQDEVFGV